MSGFFQSMLHSLKAGARGALLLAPEVRSVGATPGVLVALVALSLGVTIATQAIHYGVPGRLDLWGLRGALFDLPLVLLAGWWAARVSLMGIGPLSLPVALISMGIVIEVVFLAAMPALQARPEWLVTAYYGVLVWWWIGAARLLARFTGRAPRANWPGLLLLMLICLASFLPATPLWRADPKDDERGRHKASIEREDAFHAQAHLLDQAIEKLLPQRAGVEDLYFVGFASHASQDVFRKELEVIAPLMRERFDTEGRSLELVNNPATVLTRPLATRTNLGRALKAIGARMDRDEDVAVLYLTSHGSRTHELDITFWPLELMPITPASLKRMLDEAGIKWRVVIVSACYAGGYIEPLKDDTTLVMTAADATHQSFGCSSESSFTYFGRALFDEELRRTRSFPQAFDRATVSIRQRENEQKFEHSNPQISVGRLIAEKLKRIETRLEQAARP